MKKYILLLLMGCMIFLFFAFPLYGTPYQVTVLYDEPERDSAMFVANLLGHFEYINITMNTLQKTTAKTLLEPDVIFYVSSIDSNSPSIEIQNVLSSREKTTCYVGTHRWLGTSTTPITTTHITYKDIRFRETLFRMYPLQLGNEWKVLSTLDDGEQLIPYVARKGNTWIFQGVATSGISYLIFADLLHDVLGIPHAHVKKAMVRLEDLNPSYSGESLKKLRQTIDYLASNSVPFAMAVYPVFVTPESKYAIRLVDNKPFLETLKYAVEHGGTIIMHGTSHQYKWISGKGSEFWDISVDRPIPNERKYFHERMQYGLWIFHQAGLQPNYFEAPHYNFPLSLQEELINYFNTIAGELMVNNKTYQTTQSFPYIIRKTVSGLSVLPEQVGYIASGTQLLSLKTIEEKVRIITSIVRDPFICFFYYPYLAGDEYLKELIPFIRNMGYSFVDTGTMGAKLLYTPKEVPDLWPVPPSDSQKMLWAWFPLIAGGITAFILLFVYVRLTRRRRKDLFK